MKICVIGDTGLLGQACVRNYSKGHSILGISTSSNASISTSMCYSHVQCDYLTDHDAFFKKISADHPSLIINCAALADIGLCEQYPEKALRLNALLPEQLASIAQNQDSGFIHISTDAFFGNLGRAPRKESEPPFPCNVYGRTKLEGEQRALQQNPKTLVIRTNIVGFRNREGAPTFGEWLCQSLHEKKDIALADDFVASSIHVDYLTELIFLSQAKKIHGLLNITSRDSASKYLFGLLLAQALDMDFGHVRKVNIRDLNLVPPRAPYLVLDVTRGEALLGQRFPEIRLTVHKLAEDFKSRLRRRMSLG